MIVVTAARALRVFCHRLFFLSNPSEPRKPKGSSRRGKPNCSERRQLDQNRMIEAMVRDGLGSHPAEISDIAPAVGSGIGVQNLAIPSGVRHAHPKAAAARRGEIAYADDGAAG